jgi:ABC-type branched-subunit amino acid transport system substrate-binding protein
VQAIFVPGYYTEAALVCKQARDLGLTLPIFGGDGWEAPQLMEIGGAAVEGTLLLHPLLVGDSDRGGQNLRPAFQGPLERRDPGRHGRARV